MKQKFKFKEFSARVNPKTTTPRRPKAWVVGAKFKRPLSHLRGGEVLTVKSITENKTLVYAVEDGLMTHISQCELV